MRSEQFSDCEIRFSASREHGPGRRAIAHRHCAQLTSLQEFDQHPLGRAPSRLRRAAYFAPISRMRAVSARPSGSLKVSNSGESTSLFTTAGFPLPVTFSITPRSPKYCP